MRLLAPLTCWLLVKEGVLFSNARQKNNSSRISRPWQAGSVAAIELRSGLTAWWMCQSRRILARQSQAGGRNRRGGLEVRVVVEQHMCLASHLWPCRNMGLVSTAFLVSSKETTDMWGFNFEAELTSNKIQTQ